MSRPEDGRGEDDLSLVTRWEPRRAFRSAWGFTAVLLVVVVGLILLVDQLHQRATAQRQAQVVASELEQDTAELRIAEEVLMTGDQVDDVRVEISDEIRDLNAAATQLRALNDADVVFRIEQSLQAVDSALQSQVASLRAGDLEGAEEVGEQRTRPALDALDARVEEANDHYASAAVRASRVSALGLWAAILTAGVTIGGLSWRHERTRRAAERQMEQRLRERVAEVAEITERHRQLEALKYSFVTAVSHELRTPLTAIYGSLEMLEDGDLGPLPAQVAGVVSVAARGTRRLSRLVEDIIDLERLESGHFGFHLTTHELHALLLEAVESLAPLSQRSGVRLVIHETHAHVLCDGDRVQQALINLVGNAIKFTAPGGSVHLEAVHRGEEVEVAVRDEGRGIPAEQLDAVFDRFHQVDTHADRAKGGTGLGLTITRHILEAQGGRIWVESDYGTGTVFRFTLRAASPEQHDAEELVEVRTELP